MILLLKQTMGQLVGQYIDHNDPDYENNPIEPETLNEAFFSFSFRIESDLVYYETKKETLAKIVSERNELIHHLLPHFDTNSSESCNKLGLKLDSQADEIRKEIEELRVKIQLLNDGRKQIADFLVSEEGKTQLDQAYLRRSRLVVLLGDIANQMARPDGWTLMNVAGQLIRQHALEEVAVLKERYGHTSLKSLIQAAGIFDIFEEPTDKAGIRLLFKLKSGWQLSHS